MPLDEFLPDYGFNECHSTRVRATPSAALAAARTVTPREVPLLVLLMAIRRAPMIIRGRRPLASPRPIVEEGLREGFVLLADRPDELVLGAVGRFWQPTGGIERIAAEDFAAFEEPGNAKAVIDFRVEPAPGGCLLATETRIHATDEDARRAFGRYWRVIKPGSALIRRDWLRAVRRRAERA